MSLISMEAVKAVVVIVVISTEAVKAVVMRVW